MSSKKLNLGLFGFGCVGQGLYQVLNASKGINAEIKKICVKDRAKFRPFPNNSYFTFEADEILDDPKIDVVVELIDDAEAAYELVKKAVAKGKAVVTANKKLIADHFEELYLLQRTYNVPILYEAACAASIPVIRNLEEYYDNDLLTSVKGILNGSSNYILTRVFDDGFSFSKALYEAQESGFAESDPTLDVEGVDSRYKLSIIIAHAFGIYVSPEQIINIGITSISEKEIQYAREKGQKIKLIAKCEKIDNEIYAIVAPQFVPEDSQFYRVEEEYNAVEIQGVFSDQQLFVGKGAGGHPTGSALLSDISALSYDYKYEYKKLKKSSTTQYSANAVLQVFVGAERLSRINLEDFEDINQQYIGDDYNYVIGQIKYNTLREVEWIGGKDVSVIFFDQKLEKQSDVEDVELKGQLAEVY